MTTDDLSLNQQRPSAAAPIIGLAGGGLAGLGATKFNKVADYVSEPAKYSSWDDLAKEVKDTTEFTDTMKNAGIEEDVQTKVKNTLKEVETKEAEWETKKDAYIEANKYSQADKEVMAQETVAKNEVTQAEQKLAAKKQTLIDAEKAKIEKNNIVTDLTEAQKKRNEGIQRSIDELEKKVKTQNAQRENFIRTLNTGIEIDAAGEERKFYEKLQERKTDIDKINKKYKLEGSLAENMEFVTKEGEVVKFSKGARIDGKLKGLLEAKRNQEIKEYNEVFNGILEIDYPYFKNISPEKRLEILKQYDEIQVNVAQNAEILNAKRIELGKDYAELTRAEAELKKTKTRHFPKMEDNEKVIQLKKDKVTKYQRYSDISRFNELEKKCVIGDADFRNNGKPLAHVNAYDYSKLTEAEKEEFQALKEKLGTVTGEEQKELKTFLKDHNCKTEIDKLNKEVKELDTVVKNQKTVKDITAKVEGIAGNGAKLKKDGVIRTAEGKKFDLRKILTLDSKLDIPEEYDNTLTKLKEQVAKQKESLAKPKLKLSAEEIAQQAKKNVEGNPNLFKAEADAVTAAKTKLSGLSTKVAGIKPKDSKELIEAFEKGENGLKADIRRNAVDSLKDDLKNLCERGSKKGGKMALIIGGGAVLGALIGLACRPKVNQA